MREIQETREQRSKITRQQLSKKIKDDQVRLEPESEALGKKALRREGEV